MSMAPAIRHALAYGLAARAAVSDEQRPADAPRPGSRFQAGTAGSAPTAPAAGSPVRDLHR